MDETTDIALQKQIIVYVTAKSAVRFLGLINIDYGSVQGLQEATVKLVGDRRINICKVTYFSSEGASAMVGAKGGLRTRLNMCIYGKLHMEFDEKGYLFFSGHCVCHRMNLSVDDVLEKEGMERRVSELVDKIEIVVKYCYISFPEDQREGVSTRNSSVRFPRLLLKFIFTTN